MNRKSYCLLKHLHPSKSEAEYCMWLLARMQNKEIGDFHYIHTVQLSIDDKPWKTWAADFGVIENDGSLSVHESKGWNRSDDSFRLKLNICMRNHPDLPVYVNKVRVKFTPTGRIVLRPRKKTVWPKRLLRQK